jgi:hypothetical protein
VAHVRDVRKNIGGILEEPLQKIRGPLIITNVDFQDSIAEETAVGANMSVYWPLTIFAAFKAVKYDCEAFKSKQGCNKAQRVLLRRGCPQQFDAL